MLGFQSWATFTHFSCIKIEIAFQILVAGVGWAFADFLLTRVIFLWVGARGIEFDWKYMQKSFDANVNLVSVQ